MKKIVFIVFLSGLFLSFSYPKNMDKKIKKEIKNTLELTDFKLHLLSIKTENLPIDFNPESFFKIQSDSGLKGYLYYGQSKGKAALFDYIVIFDKDLIIAKVKLMVYRESYGGEIGSVRWLKQFMGLKPSSTVIYKKDIMGISGATISASALTKSVNKLLKTLTILREKNLI